MLSSDRSRRHSPEDEEDDQQDRHQRHQPQPRALQALENDQGYERHRRCLERHPGEHHGVDRGGWVLRYHPDPLRTTCSRRGKFFRPGPGEPGQRSLDCNEQRGHDRADECSSQFYPLGLKHVDVINQP